MKRRIKIKVVKEVRGYSASVIIKNHFIATESDTFEKLRKEILEALNLTFEEQGFVFTQDHLRYEYDLESFFDFYRVINVKALSERINMNQSLLAQYINGIKKPSHAQTMRILEGVHQIGRELTEARFLL